MPPVVAADAVATLFAAAARARSVVAAVAPERLVLAVCACP
jgi:hypothetical protein